jgi:hypothetical protein
MFRFRLHHGLQGTCAHQVVSGEDANPNVPPASSSKEFWLRVLPSIILLNYSRLPRGISCCNPDSFKRASEQARLVARVHASRSEVGAESEQNPCRLKNYMAPVSPSIVHAQPRVFKTNSRDLSLRWGAGKGPEW